MINKLLSNDFGCNVISCILGLGLASLFKKICVDDNCLIIKSSSDWDIENKIFQNNNKCFKFKTERTKCNL